MLIMKEFVRNSITAITNNINLLFILSRKFFIASFLILLLPNCDEEIILPPDEIPIFTQKLKGKVSLENQTEHSNALVYLDSLNRGVGTDSTGSYTIIFSDEDSIYNGVFTLHYFVNEFGMDSAKYAFVNGKVKLDSLDVDKDGNLPDKNMKQLLRVEGWTDKLEYRIGDTIIYTAKFTNLSDRKIHVFIPNCWGTFGYVSLYNENYPSFSLIGCDPVTADCDIDIYPQGFYEGTGAFTIRDSNYCIINVEPLLPDQYIVVADLFIDGRLLNFWTNKMDNFIGKKWYKLHRGNSPKLDWYPNKYKFPTVSIIE